MDFGGYLQTSMMSFNITDIGGMFVKLMDVNVWGVARVTTAMLPLMRKDGGRIVVMASGLGRIMQPSRSPYGTNYDL